VELYLHSPVRLHGVVREKLHHFGLEFLVISVFKLSLCSFVADNKSFAAKINTLHVCIMIFPYILMDVGLQEMQNVSNESYISHR
jgi:hypothetical protein